MSDSRYYRVDEGGLVAFRRSPKLSDQADVRRFPAAGKPTSTAETIHRVMKLMMRWFNKETLP
jgi:hypothetical protein